MKYYPGSKTPIKTFERPSHPRVREHSEHLELEKPKKFLVNGEIKEFFTVGSLAGVLNRRSVTIRKWENEGVIPSATFILPSSDKRGRRRLYTREQILGLKELAQEEGLLEPNVNGKWKAVGETNFKERALKLFKDLEGK